MRRLELGGFIYHTQLFAIVVNMYCGVLEQWEVGMQGIQLLIKVISSIICLDYLRMVVCPYHKRGRLQTFTYNYNE